MNSANSNTEGDKKGQGYFMPTRNKLSDLYGADFYDGFWDRVGVNGVELTVKDLKPVIVNPLTIIAAQNRVLTTKIIAMRDMRRKDFLKLVAAQSSDVQPVILIRGESGYISIQGHHRLYLLQEWNVRKIGLYVVPDRNWLNYRVASLFREYGYIDTIKKWPYSISRMN